MDVKQLKDDVQTGRIGLDRLIDLIEAQQRVLRAGQAGSQLAQSPA